MKKRILVPTDFSDNGINLIQRIADSDLENFELLFTHLFYLPDGIQELLFNSYRVKEYEVISKRFTDAYRSALAVKFDKQDLHRFPVKFFYGNSLAFFKHFLAANKIKAVIWSHAFPCGKINSASIDVFTAIKKCGLEIIDAEQLTIKQQTPKFYAPQEQYSV